MRRGGKTTFLCKCWGDRLEKGTPRESVLRLSFEGERLLGMLASDLSWLFEEYFRPHPGVRDAQTATFLFDEIQTASGWEPFVRLLLGMGQWSFSSPVRPCPCSAGKWPAACRGGHSKCCGGYIFIFHLEGIMRGVAG